MRIKTAAAGFRKAVYLLSLSCAFGGCALFEPEIRVRVIIPPAPQAWLGELGALRFAVFSADGDGVLGWRAEAAEGAASVLLSCSKRGNTPVLAYPWSAAQGTAAVRGTLRPAGGLFPLHLRQGADAPELVLSWEDGALAEVFRALCGSGYDAAPVNAGRLAERMREAPDPWVWDVSAIAQDIASGQFSAYDIEGLPVADVRLGAPAGDWLTESPFRPAVAAGQDGTLILEGLGFGLHSLFSLGRRMDFYLDARGVSVVSPPPP